MEQQALEDLQRLIAAALDVDSDFHVKALPNGMTLHSLEPYMAARFRYRGHLLTRSFDDFVTYCKRWDTAECFINPEDMTATAIFNLGTLVNPGHADHTASLKMRKTAPMAELEKVDGRAMSQKGFAEWLEEWVPYLTILDGIGEDAKVIDPIQAIAAVRSVTIAARAEQTNEEGDRKSSRSRFAEVEAKTRGVDPALIRFRCEPYHGLDARDFSLRISILTGDDTPHFKLRVLQMEAEEEDMAAEFQEKLQAAFEDTNVTTYIGVFSAQ